MDIYTVWVIDGSVEPWAVGAWDAASVDVNYEGYLDALSEAYRVYGKDNVRVIKSHIDYDAVIAAFKPQVAHAAITGAEPVDAS